MAHCVQLIIGKGGAISAFLRQWPVARAVDLNDGWKAIPVDEPLHNAVEAAYPGSERPSGFDVSPFGLDRVLATATASGGGLAYVETEYFGGAGEQSAMAYVDGREVMAPQRSRGGGGPINQSLRAIGAARTEANDEFDTVGLGLHRSMDDYSPEGPRRLRQPQPAPADDNKAYVPMWKIALVIAAMIAVGVFAAAAG
jgi:hypothetical protein